MYSPAHGMNPEFIRITQMFLTQLGFDVGQPDGIYGEKTKQALENFYALKGQKFDGILDENERNDIMDAIVNGTVNRSELSSSGYSLFDKKKYLGCWGCPQFNLDSICNRSGNYGNRFSDDSIWMRFGTYGSRFSMSSPWNRFSSDAPKLYDFSGTYHGRFSINTFSGFKQSKELKAIYELANGDLSQVRDAICD